MYLLQIWLLPDHKGAAPSYVEKPMGDAAIGRFHLIHSKDGRADSISINQDADVSLAKFVGGDTASHSLRPQRHAWLQVAEGELTLSGHPLQMGDGATVSEESLLTLNATKPSQVLLFDPN